jgi:hypothetical protein
LMFLKTLFLTEPTYQDKHCKLLNPISLRMHLTKPKIPENDSY